MPALQGFVVTGSAGFQPAKNCFVPMGNRMKWGKFKDGLQAPLNLLLPPRCLVCHRTNRSGPVCHRCWPKESTQTLRTRCKLCYSETIVLNRDSVCDLCLHHPLPFRQFRYLWAYEDRVSDLITTAKYEPSPRLTEVLAQYLGKIVGLLFEEFDWDLIVPMPSSNDSLKTRMFNQCAPLAKSIGQQINVSLNHFALKRTRHFAAQASLKLESRLKNVQDSFWCNLKAVERKRLLLVDDVYTTGATAAEATRSLLINGATSVDLVVLAVAKNWEESRHKVFRTAQP